MHDSVAGSMQILKMSKIDSLSHSPQVTRIRPASVPSQTVTAPAKADTNTSVQALKDRMRHWFAQAGISPARSGGVDLDASKKLQRRKAMQAQRQLHNLEKILEQAMDFSPAQGSEENLDPDWFFSFINMAENVHSPAMQELWAKIFATEISQPGSFSLRSLAILQQLTQRDAKMFSLAVSLSSRRRGDYSPRILYGYYQKPSLFSIWSLARGAQLNLAQFGLTYPDLLGLMDLGLIYSSEIESGELNTGTRSEWRVAGEPLHLAPRHRGTLLNYYKFTAAGAELSRLVPVKPQAPYLQSLKQLLSKAFELH